MSSFARRFRLASLVATFAAAFFVAAAAPAAADSFDNALYGDAGYLANMAPTAGFTPRVERARFTPFRRAVQVSSSSPRQDWFRPVDRGGRIGDYLTRIVAASGQRHEIRGDCMSACTMWLGHRGSCVAQDAVLHFHGATDRGASAWGRGGVSGAGNAALLAFYPARVRSVVRPWLASTQFRTLTGAQLIGLGVPACA